MLLVTFHQHKIHHNSFGFVCSIFLALSKQKIDISKADYCPVLGHLIYPKRQNFNLLLE